MSAATCSPLGLIDLTGNEERTNTLQKSWVEWAMSSSGSTLLEPLGSSVLYYIQLNEEVVS